MYLRCNLLFGFQPNLRVHAMSQSELERFVSDLQKDDKLKEEMQLFIQLQAGLELTEEQLDSIVGGIANPSYKKLNRSA